MLTASLKAFALSTLVVSPAHLVLRLRDGQALELPSASNTAVGYSRDTFRGPRINVGTGFIPLVVPGRGAFGESGAHFISIEFKDAGGYPQGVLLEARKDTTIGNSRRNLARDACAGARPAAPRPGRRRRRSRTCPDGHRGSRRSRFSS